MPCSTSREIEASSLPAHAAAVSSSSGSSSLISAGSAMDGSVEIVSSEKSYAGDGGRSGDFSVAKKTTQEASSTTPAAAADQAHLGRMNLSRIRDRPKRLFFFFSS